MAKKKKIDKLAQDAAAAKASGMSYGKWKAVQEQVELRKKEVISRACVCAYCGNTFYTNNGHNKKYCDDICKSQASRERHKEWHKKYMIEYRAKKKESGGTNDGKEKNGQAFVRHD